MAAADSPTFVPQFPLEEVPALANRYSYRRDEGPPLTAGAAARDRGHYTRAELILACEWKTSRTKSWVAANAPGHVEAVTREALSATDERARMSVLRRLDGVKVPTASALLYFVFPDEYPIIDRRALESLGYSAPSYSLKLWAAYLDACRGFAAEQGVSLRTLDKALWQASKERDGGICN